MKGAKQCLAITTEYPGHLVLLVDFKQFTVMIARDRLTTTGRK